MHERISVHPMCFAGSGVTDFLRHCRDLGARRVGLIGRHLLDEGGLAAARDALAGGDWAVESIVHVFQAGRPLSADKSDWQASRETLSRLIDIAAELDARSIYMLTGGRGTLGWEEAADCFSGAIAPCVDQAKAAGVALAIENASALYADIHIAHSLADTIRLAEMADIGLCIETFFCWAEAGLQGLMDRAMPRCALIQLSDYVYGDRSLPARAVPGDGAIPLRQIVSWAIEAGYTGAFDLELLGPRIDAEGSVAAVRRAADHVGQILTELGA